MCMHAFYCSGFYGFYRGLGFSEVTLQLHVRAVLRLGFSLSRYDSAC